MAGNVRELENAIGHACMMTLDEVIDLTDLPPHLRGDGKVRLRKSKRQGRAGRPSGRLLAAGEQ